MWLSGHARCRSATLRRGARCYIIPKISTKGSTALPPKWSHRPSGKVRQRVLPGSLRKGWVWPRVSSLGRPRSHASAPCGEGFTPGGRCGHSLSRCFTRASSVWDERMQYPNRFCKPYDIQLVDVNGDIPVQVAGRFEYNWLRFLRKASRPFLSDWPPWHCGDQCDRSGLRWLSTACG
jgi:hypothetical protein